MKKRSSTAVQLVLITSLLASCSKPVEDKQEVKQRLYMRADSTAQYTEVTDQYQRQSSGGSGMGSAFLWYMAFRHLGGGMGYASNGLHPNSVVGKNAAKSTAFSNAQRGGFGKTAAATATSTNRSSAS